MSKGVDGGSFPWDSDKTKQKGRFSEYYIAVGGMDRNMFGFEGFIRLYLWNIYKEMPCGSLIT